MTGVYKKVGEMTNGIIESIKNMTDEQLLENIGLGKDAFQDGVYHLYLLESRQRGFNLKEEILQELETEINKDNKKKDARVQVLFGIFIIIFFCGILSFIPGLNLIAKDEHGNYIAEEKYWKFGKFLICWSIMVWCFAGIAAIIAFLKHCF